MASSSASTSSKRPTRRRLFDYDASYWADEASESTVTNISATDDLPALVQAVEELSVSEKPVCHACDQIFVTFVDQRAHFRSDWHKYNAQRRLHGRPTVTEAEFDVLSDLGSVGSLSGSESEESDNESDIQTAPSAPTIRLAEKFEFRDPRANDSFLVLYRAALPDHETLASLAKRGTWAVIMTGGGHFCAGLWDVKGNLVKHKSFHRYTSRKKQGGSQAAADAARGGGGRIKSAGATLRRHGEQALQNEVRTLLKQWHSDLVSAQCIYIRASQREKRDLLVGWDGSPLQEAQDEKCLRNIPIPTRRATLKEATRVYEELSSVRVSSVSLVESAEVQQKLAQAKPAVPARASKPPKATPGKQPKEKGTDHLKKRDENEKKTLQITEQTEKTTESPTLDPELVELFKLCLGGLTVEVSDLLVAHPSLKSTLFEKHYFPDDPRFEKIEGDLGLVGVAAVGGHAVLVENLLDLNVSPSIGASPYVSAKGKAVRLLFRKYWGQHPNKFEYAAAGIPGPLSEAELEEMAERERAKRRKEREKKKDKAREKAKTPEQRARELRAAAAEARFLGNKCAGCQKSLNGITPFSRLAYKYCSTDCVNKHKQILNSM